MKKGVRILIVAGFFFILPFFVSAEEARFKVPDFHLKLADIGPTTLGSLVVDTAAFATAVVGIIAIILLLYSGIQRVASAGNKEMISESEEIMWAALTGLLIVFLSVIGLNTINPNLTKFQPLKLTTVGYYDPDPVKAELQPVARGSSARSGGASPNADGHTITNYYPVTGPGEKRMEGGEDASRPRPPGAANPTGTNKKICTLEMYWQWLHNHDHVGDCNYVTIASDPSHYGQWYTITDRSWRNAANELHSAQNIPGFVHDTGDAFQGRPDKFDFPTDLSTSDTNARGIDRQQPPNPNTRLLPRTGLAG